MSVYSVFTLLASFLLSSSAIASFSCRWKLHGGIRTVSTISTSTNILNHNQTRTVNPLMISNWHIHNTASISYWFMNLSLSVRDVVLLWFLCHLTSQSSRSSGSPCVCADRCYPAAPVYTFTLLIIYNHSWFERTAWQQLHMCRITTAAGALRHWRHATTFCKKNNNNKSTVFLL